MNQNLSIKVFTNNHLGHDLVHAVQNGASLPVKPEVLNELRMTQSSLTNVFPVPQNSLSHRCLGVIRDQTRGFIIIGYNLVLQNDINWERARTNFQSFLARHFHTAHVNIDVIGVAWNASHCWYIMRENEVIIHALTSNSNNNQNVDLTKVSISIIIAGIAIVLVVGLLKR
ncbi:unnamed protein product [Adineta ricciae]|uniref:Uncharacterized protein n=1 Tax=Adineta ricciae TaxID=249248 RepID=A0A813NZM9_ADIRI|nr:unnamed protein product [Adineta ricciae]